MSTQLLTDDLRMKPRAQMTPKFSQELIAFRTAAGEKRQGCAFEGTSEWDCGHRCGRGGFDEGEINVDRSQTTEGFCELVDGVGEWEIKRDILVNVLNILGLHRFFNRDGGMSGTVDVLSKICVEVALYEVPRVVDKLKEENLLSNYTMVASVGVGEVFQYVDPNTVLGFQRLPSRPWRIAPPVLAVTFGFSRAVERAKGRSSLTQRGTWGNSETGTRGRA
ncbi:hypothetical protein EDB92DRAFT_1820647 [Lactarius akahatsu]|uniref:Uncharacterized protein n=1 Tax=Lactarius akahatsu TaxID=416441 RepID=A0AAD4Q8K0_9AGAM|nr:hypothetical protein EDB92DRAFT_1820647 [Lactarius akahatsu]